MHIPLKVPEDTAALSQVENVDENVDETNKPKPHPGWPKLTLL
jgi:hypothetical protein